MPAYFRISALLLALATPLRSQNAAPAAAAPAPTSAIKTSVRLVVVDVVVKDRSHHPLHGLTETSFTLTENGKPQKIRNFEEHTSGAPSSPLPAIDLPPGQFSNYVTVPQTPSLNIILLDALNTPFDSQFVVRQQLVDYLKQVKPGTRVAIFALTTRLSMLQSFTSDPARLRASLDKKGLPKNSPLLAGNTTDITGPQSDPSAVAASQTVSLDDQLTQEFETFHNSVKTQLRVGYTLAAMNQLGRYLSALPGRKNLIWFSGSFPINILPEADKARNVNGFAGVADMQDEFRETTDLLSRARVSVYPVDARGVHALGGGAADGDAFGGFQKERTQAASSEADALSTMQAMADQTGGQAFYNNNDLARAVNDAVEDGSSYYTLAYSPSDNIDDGNYRNIKVTLDRNANLEYRRGYYAEDANRKRPVDLNTAMPGNEASLRTAMMHGAPDSTQVTFRIAAAPVDTPTHNDATRDNVTTPSTKGPFSTISVHFLVEPSDIGFVRAGDNRFQPSIRFVVLVYSRDGVLLEGLSRLATSTFDAAQVHGMLQRGLQYPLEVDVPAKGDFYLRVGVVDRLRNRFGSLELPIDAIRRLPPVPLLPAGATPQPENSISPPPAATR